MRKLKCKLKCELKSRALVDKSDLKSRLRSKYLKTFFEKSTEGEVYFSVDSQTIPGKKHIVILSAPSITEDTSINDLKKILKKEDIKVACSCEAFLYWGYKFITYKAQAGIDPEGRVPVVRNPQQRGMLCKHILAVLKSLGIS